MKNMKTAWFDSTVADRITLKPIRHASYNMQKDMVLNFVKIVTVTYYSTKKTENFGNRRLMPMAVK